MLNLINFFIFSFKTKGNLTKHMKSKAHFKKCTELGISPIPTMPDDDVNDPDEMSEKNRRIIMNGGEDMQRDDSETEDNESDDEGEDDSGDEGKNILLSSIIPFLNF